MRPGITFMVALVLPCFGPACGPGPAPAEPDPTPPVAPAVAVVRGVAPLGVDIPLPAPRNVPRDATALEIFEGPCAWTPGYVMGRPKSVAWRVEAPGDGGPIAALTYGTAPQGWSTAAGPEALEDGCWCVVAEPCCDAMREFEVRDGSTAPVCEAWGSPSLPLPAGELEAYLFTPTEREERMWRVALGGTIQVLPGGFAPESAETVDELEARWTASDDPPLALLPAADPGAAPDMVRPGRLVLSRGGREQEMVVRWISSRDETMLAAMLVPLQGSARVTLLTLDTMLTCTGIEGVIAHGVGRLDADDLPDLVFLYDPCECSDGCPGGKGIVVEVYLTQALDGRRTRSLAPRAELAELAARAFSAEAGWEAAVGAASWSIDVSPAHAGIVFRGPTGIGRSWTLSLGPDDIDLQSAPLAEPAP